jgi:hypothetical protein
MICSITQILFYFCCGENIGLAPPLVVINKFDLLSWNRKGVPNFHTKVGSKVIKFDRSSLSQMLNDASSESKPTVAMLS